MHGQVGTSQGSTKSPPNDAQVGERGEVEGGMIEAFLPKTSQSGSAAQDGIGRHFVSLG